MKVKPAMTESAKLKRLFKQHPKIVYYVTNRQSGRAVIGHLPKRFRKKVELRVWAI